MNIWDEGIPLSGAVRLMNGERPVRDFISYPPGRYLLYSVALKLAGAQGPRILMAILSAFMTGCLWLISRRLTSPFYSLIPLLLYLLMPMHYYYRFFTMMLILMIFVIKNQVGNTGIRNFVLSGVLGAIVLWFRVFLGHFLCLILPVLAMKRLLRNKAPGKWRFFIPTIIVWTSYLSLVCYSGGWNSWLTYLRLCQNFSAAGLTDMSLEWPPLWSMAYLESNDLSILFEDSLFYMSLILIGCLIGYAIKHHKRVTPLESAFISTAVLGFGLVIWRAGFGNLIRVSPLLSLSAVFLLTRVSLLSRFFKVTGALVTMGIIIDAAILNPFIYQSAGVKRICDSQLSHPRLQAKVLSPDCQNISYLTSLLEPLGEAGETTMLVLPFHTLYNYLLEYQCPAYFDWLLPGNFSDVELRENMINNVTDSVPDIVLLNDEGFDGIADRAFSRQYPELMLWVMCDYFRWAEYQSYEIYRRKPKTGRSLMKTSGLDVSIQGAARISDLMINDKKVPTIELDGTAEWSVVLDGNSSSVFTVSVLIEGNSMEQASGEISIMANDEELMWYELKENQVRDSFYIPLNLQAGSQNILTVRVDWSESHPGNRIVFLDPYVFQDRDNLLIVDRWCTSL